jgi:hypothetical protein
MDLRVYYKKIRDMEATIADEFPIVVSKETADGGRRGTKTEVSRQVAARLVVDGIADLAEPPEVDAFRKAMAEARRVAEQASASANMHLTVLSAADLAELKAQAQRPKE